MDAEQRDPVLHGAPSEAECAQDEAKNLAILVQVESFKKSHSVSESGQVSERLKTEGKRDVVGGVGRCEEVREGGGVR